MKAQFKDHIRTITELENEIPKIIEAKNVMLKTLNNGGCIYIAGNGGSAADSQHFAAELVGRFKKERVALKSIALTTDSSAITAIANDYSYEDIFTRQLQGLATSNDLFIGISTSGNSKNIVNASKYCEKSGIKSITLTGSNGGELLNYSNLCIMVPSDVTARIQEAHIFIVHLLCQAIDEFY